MCRSYRCYSRKNERTFCLKCNEKSLFLQSYCFFRLKHYFPLEFHPTEWDENKRHFSVSCIGNCWTVFTKATFCLIIHNELVLQRIQTEINQRRKNIYKSNRQLINHVLQTLDIYSFATLVGAFSLWEEQYTTLT